MTFGQVRHNVLDSRGFRQLKNRSNPFCMSMLSNKTVQVKHVSPNGQCYYVGSFEGRQFLFCARVWGKQNGFHCSSIRTHKHTSFCTSVLYSISGMRRIFFTTLFLNGYSLVQQGGTGKKQNLRGCPVGTWIYAASNI